MIDSQDGKMPGQYKENMGKQKMLYMLYLKSSDSMEDQRFSQQIMDHNSQAKH